MPNEETQKTEAVASQNWEGSGKLKRSLKWVYVYSLATGAIFTFMGYWDGVFLSACGPATWLAFLLMTVLIMPIAYVYCELAALMPYTGAELRYATVGLNKHAGFWSSWLIMLAWVAVPPAGVMGVLDWLNFTTNAGISDQVITLIGCGCLVAFCLMSMYKIEIAGSVQTFMLFAAIFGCLLTVGVLLFSGKIDFANMTPHFRSGFEADYGLFWGWMIGLSIIITPYFGFEVVPNLVEEGNFPIKSLSQAIWGSAVSAGVVYVLFYFFTSNIAPWEELTNNGDFSGFVILKQMVTWSTGWKRYALFFGITCILFPIATSVLGFWISSVRLLYAMGRHNFLPKSFAKTNKHSEPIVPNLLVLAIGILFLLFRNSTFVSDFFILMAIGVAATYLIVMTSAIRISTKHPEWERPFKLPGGMAMRILALCIAGIITFGCVWSLTWGSMRVLAGYLGLGLLIWLYAMVAIWPKRKVWMQTPDGERTF